MCFFGDFLKCNIILFFLIFKILKCNIILHKIILNLLDGGIDPSKDAQKSQIPTMHFPASIGDKDFKRWGNRFRKKISLRDRGKSLKII